MTDPIMHFQNRRYTAIFILAIITGLACPRCLAQESPQDPSAAEESQPKDAASKLQSTLLPEGFRINGLIAKLVKHPEQSRWFLLFSAALDQLKLPNSAPPSTEPAGSDAKAKIVDVDPFSKPIEVLPGKWLTAMNKIAGDKIDLSIEFRIWGEITTFHGRNYILPNMVQTFSLFGQQADSDLPETKPMLFSSKPDTSQVSENQKPVPSLEEDKIADRLRSILMAIPRTSPLEMPADPVAPLHSEPTSLPSKTSASGATTLSKWKDGDMIIDRVGRAIYDANEQLWLFTFEADSESLSEPPIVLHPCRLLEVMENIIKQSPRSTKFRISGQITHYQSRSYILLRKMLIVYDLGNLTK